MRRWRGGGGGPPPGSPGNGAPGAGAIDPYEERLDDELKDLDD